MDNKRRCDICDDKICPGEEVYRDKDALADALSHQDCLDELWVEGSVEGKVDAMGDTDPIDKSTLTHNEMAIQTYILGRIDAFKEEIKEEIASLIQREQRE